MALQREDVRTVREACAELRSRLRGGEAARVESILSSYPILGKNEEAVLELIHTEVMTRHDLGQKPTLDEWQERFPSLLGRMESLLTFQGAVGSEMPTLTDSSLPPVRPPAGRGGDNRISRIANYHIIEEIGRGGMGIVYKARQANLSRIVALKMILAGENAGIRDRARLRNEAEAAAQLVHPNVVQIFEIGDHDGLPFLAMEYVVGGNLTRMLRGMPQAFKWSARLTETLARTIHIAHQRGIVHRDLNPSNILMTPDGVPKITDFGLAKFQVDEKGVSLHGVLLGTPSYMAPEQVSAGEAAIGPATDVYALGALLYEMLTGNAPFRGFTPMETLCQVMEADLVPPSRLRHGVPEDLETICLKCLDREPSRRYGTADDLAEDLRRYNENQPIRARRTPRLIRIQQWRRRQPLAAALLAFSLFLISLLLGGTAYHTHNVTASFQELQRRISQREQEHSLFNIERSKFRERSSAVERRSYDNLLGQVKRAIEEGHLEMARDLLRGMAEGDAEKPGGFEWDYLQAVVARIPGSFPGNRGPVTCLAVADRPGLIVSGDEAGQIVLSDLQKGTSDRFRERHAGKVLRLAVFAPGGPARGVVASVGKAGQGLDVKLWDLDRRKAVASFAIDPLDVADFLFSGDGKRLTLCGGASGGRGSRSLAWSRAEDGWHPEAGASRIGVTRQVQSPDCSILAEGMEDGTVRLTRRVGPPLPPLDRHHRGAISTLAFSRDGMKLAAGSVDGSFLAWDVASGRLIVAGQGHRDASRFLAFCQRDEALVGCDGSSVLWTRRLASPEERYLLPREAHTALEWLAVSPDGDWLVAAGKDHRVTTWDLSAGTLGRLYQANARLTAPPAFAADGASLVLGCGDRRLRTWKYRDDGENQLRLGSHRGEAWSLSFRFDGRLLVSGGDDNEVRVWDLERRRQAAVLHGHEQTVTSVAFAPSLTPGASEPRGHHPGLVASAGLDGKIFLWDLDAGRPEPLDSPSRRRLLHDFGPTDRLWSVAFHPRGTHVAAAGHRGVISVWDLRESPPTRAELSSVDSPISALAFSPNGTVVASASKNGSVRFWDPEHEIPYDREPEAGSATWCLAFAPDSGLLVGGTDDRIVTLYSMDNWRGKDPIPGHPMAVRGVAVHPDQPIVATGCDDGKLRICDLLTGQIFYALSGHTARINAVQFSPDGKLIASCDHLGSVRLWGVAATGDQSSE
ncbi:WD40 repeat domain-containing serine/threonine protein kinase [Aquisphaera insulae]|uniref:WD40 repeat domain-containing serine/threonine protein kinase n=1 Tax=Aquisphaera insulae TaxID=2712864 RepID=UPI0013EB4900|nr:protein kinase [Aquisphaera insulae]